MQNIISLLFRALFRLLPVKKQIVLMQKMSLTKVSKEVVPQANLENAIVDGVPVVWANQSNLKNGLVVHLHGGAYISGPFPPHFSWLHAISSDLNMAGVLIQYAKPQQDSSTGTFPLAIEQVEKVLTKLARDNLLRGGKWIMLGDSAGGGLALSLIRRLLERKANDRVPLPACLILSSPWVSMDYSDPKVAIHEKRDQVLSRKLLNACSAMYAKNVDMADPELSPLNGSFENCPPVHICTGQGDMFYVQGLQLKEKLTQAKVQVQLVAEPNGQHTFELDLQSDIAKRAVASEIAFAKKALTPTKAS